MNDQYQFDNLFKIINLNGVLLLGTMIERIPLDINQSQNTTTDGTIAMGLPVTWILVIAGAGLFLVCLIMVALGMIRRKRAQKRMLKKTARPRATR